MNEIFVVGHRNPDTDSIVSAMAYAALRNALGDREYAAARLGQVSDETRRMLDRFHFDAPRFVKNVRTQVQDLDYDTPPALSGAVTVTVDCSGVKSHCRVKLRFSCAMWNVTSASILAVAMRPYCS